MKEGALHELPGGWVWTSLEEACKKITDGSHYTPAYVSNGYPFITISDINKYSLEFSSAKLISREDFEKLKANCNPQAGDILFSKDGTVGKVIEINVEKEFIVLSSLAIIRPYTDITLPSYLKFILQSKIVLNQAIKLKTGTARNFILSSGTKKTTESAINLQFLDEHEKNNELVRTRTNSGGVSSYRVRCVRCHFFSYQDTGNYYNSVISVSSVVEYPDLEQ